MDALAFGPSQALNRSVSTRTNPERSRGRLLSLFFAGAVLISATGCQTTSLTEEEFRRQQRGETLDPQTAAVVDAAGTVGYFGALLAAIFAK